MPEPIKFWTGEEWQVHINRLLRRRYPEPGQYQEMPARDKGDLGLEGFSRDGICYQCYAAQEPLPTKDLYEKQRDKITTDIGKFINNNARLAEIFDALTIRRWILVVPRFESTQLLAHASSKATLVVASGLSFVSPDFSIAVITDKEFEVEIAELTRIGIHVHDVTPVEPESATLPQFASGVGASELQRNLDEKAAKIPKLRTAAKRQEFSDHIIKHYLRGQSIVEWLRDRDPDQYERFLKIKKLRESALELQSLTTAGTPLLLSNTVEAFKTELRASLSVSSNTAELLAWESVADWLLRCPLDF